MEVGSISWLNEDSAAKLTHLATVSAVKLCSLPLVVGVFVYLFCFNCLNSYL